MSVPPHPAGWRLENSYAALGDSFVESIRPTPVRDPSLVIFNAPLAQALGLSADAFHAAAAAAWLSGNELPPGSLPVAQAYAGHQYAHFTMLGDGRAILLGEQVTPDRRRVDVQLKGSGRTRFSRGGDGRAALGPMLREYLISEFMHAMGIPTTRSLAVVTSGEPVYRETPLPGAILTRVAASHIRVGTFEWAAATRDPGILRTLADYTLQRHFPELQETPQPHAAMFTAIMDRQAALVARWQGVGFVHGVMNTDNMALSGETIDYGPCAFMDRCDPDTVFSSIDRHGRYAYGEQPGIAHWNLVRLAEAMLPLFHVQEGAALEWANEVIQSFPERFACEWLALMGRKLGLHDAGRADLPLMEDFLTLLHEHEADFTNSFRALCGTAPLPAELESDSRFTAWLARWEQRRRHQPLPAAASDALMQRANPAVIPRNHKVEEALAAATAGDCTLFHQLLKRVSAPFDAGQDLSGYDQPAPAGAPPCRTSCGT